MKTITWTLTAGFLVVFAPVAIHAETVNIGVTVSKNPNNSNKTDSVASGISTNGPTDVAGQDVTLTIACQGIDCTSITAVRGKKKDAITLVDVPSSDPPAKRGTIRASDVSSGDTPVTIRNGSTDITTIRLTNSSLPADTSKTSTVRTCTVDLTQTYDQENNVAHFVVTPGGSILTYPSQPPDEDDTIVVHVVGDAPIVDVIEVARTSATRTTGTLTIAGEGATIDRQVAKERNAGFECAVRTFTLGDFAPGEATVEMYSNAAGTKTTLGSFKFNVNKLYHGILSFGPVWTRQLGDESFKLAPSGQDKIIISSEEKTRNIIYAVSYTYYALGRRDFEKSYPLLRHVNPTIAFSTTSMTDHALAGVTFDLGQILITGGLHFAHVTRLSSASGLIVGGKFTGADTDIPTSKRWESHPFIGVSVDLRAASALLKALGKGQ